MMKTTGILNFVQYNNIGCKLCWLSQVPSEVNNRVQSLLLNYYFALLRGGDFSLVCY